MAVILRDAMAEGAWGLSTSFLDVDQSGRPVPSRQAEGAEFDALFDVLHDAGRGVVEVVPDLLGPTAIERQVAQEEAALPVTRVQREDAGKFQVTPALRAAAWQAIDLLA